MGKSAPQPPAPPDPKEVAQAQTGTNIGTAVANAWLGNAKEINPYGSVNYTQTGQQKVSDGDNSYWVPTFQREVTLSPAEQQKLDQQNKIQLGLNNIGLQQTQRIGGLLSSPIVQGNLAPKQINQIGNAGNIQREVGPSDYEASRKSVEDAIYSRLNPQLERDRSGLETRLVNQGFARGSEAFNREMDAFGRQANDARMQAILAGGSEQSRLHDIAMSSGQFANSAQQQAFGQEQARAVFQNQARQNNLSEQLALRNQPINEISALLSQGQVNMPQFPGYSATPMQPAPIGQYTYQSADLAQRNYQSQLAASNAAMGGMFGLGSAALYGLRFSDRRLKKNIRDLGIKLRNGLTLYAYEYLGEAKRRVGVMAQEVEQVMPRAVYTSQGFKAVDYAQVLGAA